MLLLCLSAWPVAADELVSEEESQQYFFSLLQQGQSFRIHPAVFPRYLRGVWRLDRRAHVGAGHYVQAERGDDVVMICNDERLVQIDFNRESADFIEFTGKLSDLAAGEDGSFHFGKGSLQIQPLDGNHIAVRRYDYIAVLERATGAPDEPSPMAFPTE